ncbi:MAG: DUF1269 domain-containing protein [Lachnospiraceae bacterium]|nr:DUF1269 domain-containing protein [Lachnospiraceae bacterium]
MQNIIVASFEVESEGYQAITTLRQFPGEEKSMISQAVLVKKEDGAIKSLDGFDTGAETLNDTLKGGLIGTAVGILGGPIGMLLGGSIGYMTGANLDVIDAIDNASLLEQIAGKLQDGQVALIVLADEEDESVIDGRLAGLNAVIARFDAAVVAEEVETAREVQQEMERQARVALRKEKNEEFKAKVEAQRDKIKEQFRSLGKKKD